MTSAEPNPGRPTLEKASGAPPAAGNGVPRQASAGPAGPAGPAESGGSSAPADAVVPAAFVVPAASEPAAPAGTPRRSGREDRVDRAVMGAVNAVTGRAWAVHQAAVLRIGYGLVFLIGLLREWINRREIWGDQSAWTPDMARTLLSGIDGDSLLLYSDERWWFELVYVVAIVVSALLVLGWHTRAVSVLFAILVVSFNSRSILMTDGGDTVLLLMAFYLAFTASGRVWSLDARRARRTGIPPGTGPGHEIGMFVGVVALAAFVLCKGWWWPAFVGLALLPFALLRLPKAAEQLRTATVNAVHNCALVVIAAEMCFIYGAAGLYKVQGSYWQDGTAMHYVMHLEYFGPWPALNDLLARNGMMGVAISYLTVFVQVGFVFLLFAKRTKYAVIVVLIGMHVGIAVLLGLPAFSASMTIGDALFLPTAFLLWTRRRVVGGVVRRIPRFGRPAPLPATAAPAASAGAGTDGPATPGRPQEAGGKTPVP